MTDSVIINIEPNTKPRMTRSDKWKKRPCVLQYRAFCDELRLKAGNFKLSGSFQIVFYLSMPKSWSKKKRDLMRGQRHQEVPDLDNLIKAVNDALLEQDKITFQIQASKWWADEGQIVIQNS